jgi:hypothetical protein
MRPRTRPRYCPQLEALEERAVPSITPRPTADLVGPQGTISILGSPRPFHHPHSHLPRHGHGAVVRHGDGGDEGNPGVLPPSSHSHGKTYAEWSAAWWQYALNIPVDHSPFLDSTGADFAVGQSGDVWYLSGTFCPSSNGVCNEQTPATVVRNVTVPAGKALFFPILNSEFDNFDPATGKEDLGFTVDQLRAQAAAGTLDAVGNMTATVDGRAIHNLEQYRAISPVFSYSLPANNIAGVPGPVTVHTAVADGYYLLLAPLSVGQHTIHFTGNLPHFNFALDVTYHITVRG